MNTSDGPPSSSSSSQPNLLALILDITTFTWSHRNLARKARDKAQASKNRPSAGPATLDDVLTSILALGASFSCLNRDNVLIVIAATEDEVSVLFPRKGGVGSMEEVVMGGGADGEAGERIDMGLLNDYVRLGVAELVNRAAERAESRAATKEEMQQQSSTNNNSASTNNSQRKTGAAIASALSLALCTINRFMVASHAGVSALADASMTQRRDDEGILALMGGNDSAGGSSKKSSQTDGSNLLSPRALIVQASPDRTTDYNALMNCAFAANKSEIVIDGCFIPSGIKDDDKDSPFLQQMVDQTKGVYLSVPSGAAQVGGALSEVLMSVFLPPSSTRMGMNLPRLTDVDFRARCFETGESINVAQVCNQCLSIFKERPREVCLTCGAKVRRKSAVAVAVGSSGGGGTKKMKIK